MSVNLTKHQDSLLRAWKDVVDDKISTDWALFGYEKQSNDLYVVEKGDGGIEELIDELNSGKIMYAFVKVICPNSGLPKFVFINWQGEGAPLTRKGACANHVLDVSNFFKGSHVTINARMEDDVEPSLILDKVSKASASTFNFKDRSEPVENMKPVGSVYKRIRPTAEINPAEREKFWIKEQEEEKKRVLMEKRKFEVERKKLEDEVKEREMRDSSAREEWVKERSRSINKMREAEKNANNASRNQAEERAQWEKQLEDEANDEKERRIKSENMRRERNYEAHSLISQRKINAKAIFEQNTCAGQMSSFQSSEEPKGSQNKEQIQEDKEFVLNVQPTHRYRIPESPPEKTTSTVTPSTTSTIAPTTTTSTVAPTTTSTVATTTASRSPPEEFHYTRNLLKEGLPPRTESEMEPNAEEEEQNWDEPTLEAPPDVKDPLTEMMAEHGMIKQVVDNSDVITAQMFTNGSDLQKARALYDYQAADETEISFDPDEIITHIEQIDEGWWQGLAPDGSYGLFPANYVELLDS